MKILIRKYFLLMVILVFLNFSQLGCSHSKQTVLLWRPNSPALINVPREAWPLMTVYKPVRPCGTAVLVCPGGGYAGLAMDHEGRQVAQWLNTVSVTAFVLRYRHNGLGYPYPVPMMDAKRAIRIIRSQADKWYIDENKIGILGFSAGGHLASTIGTHYDLGDSAARDNVEKVSCKPDFMILIYPVITMNKSYTHQGSVRNLLGDHPDSRMLDLVSNENHVNSDTPPAFLVHGSRDRAVPVQNSIDFFLALKKAGVSAEMHLYEKADHGFGLGKNNSHVTSWPKLCERWLSLNNLIDQDEL